MATTNPVPNLYRTVVEDVVNNVRESFLDEGVDEQVLQELKQLWENKLQQSKAVEGLRPVQEQKVTVKQQPQTVQPQPTQLYPAQVIQQPQQVQVAQQPQPRTVQAAPQQATVTAQQPAQFQYNHVYNPVTGTIDLSNAAQTATAVLPAGLYQQQIAAALQQGATLGTSTITLQTGQGPAQFIVQAPQQMIAQQPGQPQQVQPGTTTQAYTVAAGVPVAQIATTTNSGGRQVAGHPGMIQLDGANDSSSEDDEEDDDDDKDDDNEDEKDEDGEDEQGEEEEPLNSGDDVSDEDPSELFDTDNVVVCQYDKINRAKNKWKFHLKDGIMNLNGRDFVFHKANGDAEW